MSHRASPAVPPRVRTRLVVIAAILFAATVAGMVLLWPGGDQAALTQELGLIEDVYDATVIGRREEPCPGTDPSAGIICKVVEAELDEGPDVGERFDVPLPSAFERTGLEEGDRIVLGVNPGAPEDLKYTLLDRDRQSMLFFLALGFSIAVVVLGGLRGFAALAGLGASLTVLVVFVLPAILDGESPVLVAIVGASAIAFLALYLAHGFTTMTTVALIGTVAALGLTAALAAAFVALANITGLASEEASLVNFGAASIDLQGLILAGVVLGALGAIDDMTVTQASAVWELREASPGMSDPLLFRAGMRIGRDHVASTVNTLALAYAGASMPLLILLVLSEQSLGDVANSEVVATEIVRTLVGSIGLVSAVPLTTWLATKAVPRRADLDPANAPDQPDDRAPEERMPARRPDRPDPAPRRDFEPPEEDLEFWGRKK